MGASNLTSAFICESIVNTNFEELATKWAGLLTCNIFIFLPDGYQWTFNDKNFCVLLTVAQQFVILTRFPINLLLK
jgi:hypothetical protein